MEIIPLRCNNWGGGSLRIDPTVKYFNCSSCGSSLTLKRMENTIYTEVLEEVKENTDTIVM